MATVLTASGSRPRAWVSMISSRCRKAFSQPKDLDVEFDWKTFRGTQSSWKGLEYFQRPQDRPYTEDKQDVVQGACLWGTICNASAGMGRVVTEGYGDSPWAIFVRPDSKIRKPEDLKDIPISVGMRAGSHFNVPYRLEKYLATRTYQDRQYRRLRRAAQGAARRRGRGGEPPAAADRDGRAARVRKIIEDRFKTLWWVPDNATPESCTAICVHSTAPNRRLRRTCRNICRSGSSRCRRNSKLITPGISANLAAAKIRQRALAPH